MGLVRSVSELCVLLLQCGVAQTCASLQIIMVFTGILTTVLKFVSTFQVDSLWIPKAVCCHSELERKKSLWKWVVRPRLTESSLSGWRLYLPPEQSPSRSAYQSIWTVQGLTILVLLSLKTDIGRPAKVLAECGTCLTLLKAKRVFTSFF